MLHHVPSQVANCVCLLFTAGQVAQSTFIIVTSLKTAACYVLRLNQNREVVGHKAKTVS